MGDIAISVQGVYKDFKLPHEKQTTLKAKFTSLAKGKKNRTIEKQHALKDISFDVKKGEFFGIVGRNGSGKSTLLKILAGIYQPTKGSVQLRGRLVPFIELGVGFNPELTGRENVYLNGALLGFSKEEIDAQYGEIVNFAELSDFMDQKLKNYSSGMQVRLAFSMAIRAEADILLVDEVLAVGDADFQRKCFNYFRTLKRNKKTVVFVSHDMNAVREYCDKAIMIEKSQVIASGDPDKIANKYTRLFIDESKESKEKGNGSKRWGTGQIRYTSVDVRVAKDDITIMLRAEARQNIENPNFGFSIRDASGQNLLGANTVIKKRKIGILNNHSSVILTWVFSNVLKDGDYFVEPAVVDQNGEVFDWWEEAKSFKVLKEERTPYPINPNIDLSIKVANK